MEIFFGLKEVELCLIPSIKKLDYLVDMELR